MAAASGQRPASSSPSFAAALMLSHPSLYCRAHGTSSLSFRLLLRNRLLASLPHGREASGSTRREGKCAVVLLMANAAAAPGMRISLSR